MRRIFAFAVGLSALVIPSVWAAVGCAAGDTQSSSEGSGGAGAATSSGGVAPSGGSGAGGKGGGQSGAGGKGSGSGQGGAGGAGSSGSAGGMDGGAGGGNNCVPTPEICDNIDNDCNGKVDDGITCICKVGDKQSCYTGDPATKNVGVCHDGSQTCDVLGNWGPCTGDVTPSTEVCDGLDNNCNGSEDENLGATTCGKGICTTSQDNCVNGVPQMCVPLPGEPLEKCNGLDDNCDGVVDENCDCIDGNTQPCYSGPMGTKGIGACIGGTQTCAGGKWGACAGEVTPASETCDALDNDCNGQTDDGLGVTVCGVGACQTTSPNCAGGVPQMCTPGASSPETCDGKDNDCNGQVDDGLGTVSCGIGECFNTVVACKNGQPQVCNPLPVNTEICDGKDNNCNGVIDDGDPGGGGACNTGNPGVCAAGVQHCVAGAVSCIQTVQPSIELCDNKDNDCDGAVDNGNPGGGLNCNTGNLGVCAAGTTACQNGAVACMQNQQPSSEVCDSFDNNCNGAVDEGNPGGGISCNTGKQGICAAGTTACQSGGIICNQNAQPGAEFCNNLDDNCNGQVDEGNPEGNQACNTGKLGVCAAGTTACQNGSVACNQNVQSSAETCDNKDNDCNGQVDEGNPGGGQNCNTGKPGACSAGTTACQNGSIACNQNQQPGAEVCDGVDNNCNGAVDEGNPGGGQPCNTGLLGVCAAGVTACVSGAIVCQQLVMPSAETCDGKDNNCNGQVDDGNPGGGLSCPTGKQGVCAAGTTTCSGGVVVCAQNQQPSAEVCDNKDNDCDGVTDNGNPGGGVACSTGLLGVCAAGTSACSNGAVVCTQNQAASQEICDGKDNNCDGAVDNGDPGGGGGCSTGKPGVCGPGVLHCVSGAVSCVQTTQPSAETCNNLDDNCDGAVDNVNIADGIPNSCATANSKVLTIAPGASQQVTGYVDGSGDDYFVVNFTGVGGPDTGYHPQFVTNNPMNFALYVYQGTNCATLINCPDCAPNTPQPTVEMIYPASQQGCAAYGNCTDNTPRVTSWLVRVTRIDGVKNACIPYTVTVSNK